MSLTQTQAAILNSSLASIDSRIQFAGQSQSFPANNLQQLSIEDNLTHEDVRGNLPPPSTAVTSAERWNNPRSNIKGVCATFLSFFVLGLNDASPGVYNNLLPLL
jgi:hypothetical protein